MRILHFIKGLGRGGAEMLLLHALRYADTEHFHYEYAYMLSDKNALLQELESQGVMVHLLETGSAPEYLSAPWRLASLVRDRKIDLIHAHLPVSGMVARVAGVVSRTPVVYTEHNVNERYGRLTRWGNRATWSLNSLAIAVSDPVAESIRARMGARTRIPVRTVKNGIDVEGIASFDHGGSVRADLGIPQSAPVMGSVAVFREQKRLDSWVEVAAAVLGELPDAHFILVGDGPLRAEVEGWRHARGLDHRLHLVGLKEDVRPYLKSMDLFLSSSDFEGLPLAVIEAMAAAVPIVATRAGGVPQLVGEGLDRGGLLVDIGDVPGLIDRSLQLLRDAGQSTALGLAGRIRVTLRFGVERMVRAHEALYRGVLRDRRRR